jgi:hypothetical protein
MKGILMNLRLTKYKDKLYLVSIIRYVESGEVITRFTVYHLVDGKLDDGYVNKKAVVEFEKIPHFWYTNPKMSSFLSAYEKEKVASAFDEMDFDTQFRSIEDDDLYTTTVVAYKKNNPYFNNTVRSIYYKKLEELNRNVLATIFPNADSFVCVAGIFFYN